MPPLHLPNKPQQINTRQNPKHTRRRRGDDQSHFASLDELAVLSAIGEDAEETGEGV